LVFSNLGIPLHFAATNQLQELGTSDGAFFLTKGGSIKPFSHDIDSKKRAFELLFPRAGATQVVVVLSIASIPCEISS
jgi:hypothetical protein